MNNPVEYDRLYNIAFDGRVEPYAWQRRFAEREWPEALIAPTGAGKTAGVTLAWAARRLRAPEETPRRLVWCLPMRSLVEQTADAVRGWFQRLATAGVDEKGAMPGAGDVHVLMGGVDARWIEAAERPAVLVGTQDMLLSRALMRGYASSRAVWPMEFALLHEDAQWVFDEVQSMGAGRATSAQIEAFRRSECRRGNGAARPARSLWISATLEPGWLRTVDLPAPVRVERVDPVSERDDRLRCLAEARKALVRSPAAPASAKQGDERRYVAALADAVLEAHRTGRLTLAIVNRVARAQALYAELSKRRDAPLLALIHGRFRPADRKREMDKLSGAGDLIAVATQAVEAGVDISGAVLFTELAPWPSMVQRFGRANRYAEVEGGAEIHWIDLLGGQDEDSKEADALARPYAAAELAAARERLSGLADAAPAGLPAPGGIEPARRVIRRKDFDDLFDTDPDLTGFDVDVSSWVRDADDTDVRVFWRDLTPEIEEPPRPRADELCAVPIGGAQDWLRKLRKKPAVRAWVRDPQWRRRDGGPEGAPSGWRALQEDPWPGLTLLVDVEAGGYDAALGFTGDRKCCPEPVAAPDAAQSPGGETEGHDEDPLSETGVPVPLAAHLHHVAAEAERLCRMLDVDDEACRAIVRAARWHDLGKAHEVFQDTMRRGLHDPETLADVLLAKTERQRLHHNRPCFRHELASALAFLAHEGWSRDADLCAWLIAAHHGKVRMNLRALPKERPPNEGGRFARGVREGDELPRFDLGGGEHWEGGALTLSIMELGWDEATCESWTERTHGLLARHGPFRLAWMETLLRLADWRASANERDRAYDDS